jgi:hypothetical protein
VAHELDEIGTANLRGVGPLPTRALAPAPDGWSAWPLGRIRHIAAVLRMVGKDLAPLSGHCEGRPVAGRFGGAVSAKREGASALSSATGKPVQ